MEKSFFASLFDFKFEAYVTKRVASVLYAVLTVVIGLLTVLVMIAALTNQGFVHMAFIAPLAAFILLTLVRVGFETSIALVDIAINTKKHD